MKSPEEKQLEIQKIELQNKILALKKSLKAKAKELDQEILNDDLNLFGERNSDTPQAFLLFSERVNASKRDKVLEPIKTAILNAENEIKALNNKKETMTKTGNLF